MTKTSQRDKVYHIPSEITTHQFFFPESEEIVEKMLNGEEMSTKLTANNTPIYATWSLEIENKDGSYQSPTDDKDVRFSRPWNFKLFKVYLIICRIFEEQEWKLKQGQYPTFTVQDIYDQYSTKPGTKMNTDIRDELTEIVEMLRPIHVYRYIDNPENHIYKAFKSDFISDEALLSLRKNYPINKRRYKYPIYEIKEISPLFNLAKDRGHIINVNEIVWRDLLRTRSEELFKAKLAILRNHNRIKGNLKKYEDGYIEKGNTAMLLSSIAKFSKIDLSDRKKKSQLVKYVQQYLSFLHEYHDMPEYSIVPNKKGDNANEKRFDVKA